MIENSWSTSIKIMYGLNRETHRYFLEPLTDKPHIKKILAQRFIKFTSSINKSKKVALPKIFNIVKEDCCSFTGANLRQLMLLLKKDCIEAIEPNDMLEIQFSAVPEEEKWRIPIVKEILDLKTGVMFLPGDGLNSSEIDDLLDLMTTEK